MDAPQPTSKFVTTCGRACTALLAAWLSGWCFAQEANMPEPPKPAFVPKITFSQETTWATEPLGPNGGVDYVTFFNRRAARGVTSENNAVVILSRVLGPAPGGGRGLPDRYYDLLEIARVPMEGPYFEDFWKWWELKEKKLPPGGEKDFWGWEEQANARPWTAKEFPDLAEWLTDMEAPLRVAAEASKRSEFFSPSPEDADTPLCQEMLPVQSKTRSLCRVLVTRAMLRLGEEDRFAAWDDLLVAHRLARLIGRGPFGMDGLIGYGTEREAIIGELQLISATQPSSKFTKRYLKQLGQLPPLSPIIDKIDNFERAMYLDVCQQLARGRLDKDDFGDERDVAWIAKFFEGAVNRQVDWDSVLRSGNRRFDLLVAAARLPTYREREAMLRPLDEEHAVLAERHKQAAELFTSLKGRADLTALTSDVLWYVWMKGIREVHRHETRCQQWFRNLEVALALSAWRGDRDSYPESLADLTPQYLPTVPHDFFTDQPLCYERTTDGYRFYSLGFNGTDDQGRGYDDTPKGDDLAVRIPKQQPMPKPE